MSFEWSPWCPECVRRRFGDTVVAAWFPEPADLCPACEHDAVGVLLEDLRAAAFSTGCRECARVQYGSRVAAIVFEDDWPLCCDHYQDALDQAAEAKFDQMREEAP